MYLGVYAHRYGFVPRGKAKSITEMEYERAIDRQMPVFIFVVDDDYPWLPKLIDRGANSDRLDTFKSRVSNAHNFRKFRDTQSFKEDLLAFGPSMLERCDKAPAMIASAQARTTIPSPPTLYAVPPYLLENRFVGRRRELDLLDEWAVSSDPVIVVHAIGGQGKSALTWRWMNERAPAAIPNFAGAVWWSFYEGGTSTTSFIRGALAYVTGEDPGVLEKVEAGERLERLLAELRRRPWLLILDGLERILVAYHRLDPGKLRDDDVEDSARDCTDPRDTDFLHLLLHATPTKTLISTRLLPRALENNAANTLPGARAHNLDGLDPADAVELLASHGIYGDREAMRRFGAAFGYHGLLIGVVGGLVKNYRDAPGDFDAWAKDPVGGAKLELARLDLKQRRNHILTAAWAGIAADDRRVLSRIAAFDDAVDFATLSVINPFVPDTRNSLLGGEGGGQVSGARVASEPPDGYESTEHLGAHLPPRSVPARARFITSLGRLEDHGLLNWDRKSNRYDLHPVVRAFAYAQLEPTDRARTFDRIREYFESLPQEDLDSATELEHLRRSLQICRALLGAGRLDEAFDLYRRLSTVLLYSIHSLGTMIALLRPLDAGSDNFRPLLKEPNDQSYALNDMALV